MPSADFCTAIRLSLDRPSTRQLHRSPRVMRVTFLLYPPHIQPSIPNDIGLWTPALPYPRLTASDTVRVHRVRSLPSASFRSHLRVGTLAVRLEVPVIKASKGLSPSSHFPVGFRLPVASASHWRYAPCLAHIRIGGRLTTPPLRHHRAYGSVPRRFGKVKCSRAVPDAGDPMHQNNDWRAQYRPPASDWPAKDL